MPTIESLEIRIKDSASQAANGIDILRSSIEKLKAITKGGVGLASVANSLRKLNTEMQNFKPVKQADFKSLSDSLEAISKVKSSSLSSNISALARIPKVTESLDSSTLEKFASKINKIVEALKPLNTELSSLKGSIGSLPNDIKKTLNVAEANDGNDKKQLGFFNTEGLKNALSGMKKLALLLVNVGKKAADLVGISGKYTENLNLFSVALGKFAKTEKEFAERSEDLLGIDSSEFMRYEAVFMNMTRGFGVASGKAVLMSRNLTQLGYDLSSLYNVSFDKAMGKLESAIAGQPRPMREWGFDLSEATLKAKALELGITKNVESMNQAEKSLIRYVQLMDTAEKIGAKGDFAKTIATTANQMRVLNESWNLFVRSVGNVLVPIANQLLPYLIAAAKAARYVADAIASLAGFKLPKVEDFEIDIDMGAEDLEDQLNGADSAAKKLKKTLMGFDELNVLPDQSSGAGTGSTSAGGTAFDIELPRYNFLEGAVESQADKIYNAWKPKLDWFIENLDRILETAKIIGGVFLAWKIAQAAITGISTIYSSVKDIVTKLEEMNTLQSIFAGGILIVLGATLAYEAGKSIGQGKDDLMSTITEMLGFISAAAGGAFIGLKVGAGKGALIGAVVGLGIAVVFDVIGRFKGMEEQIEQEFWASDVGKFVQSANEGNNELLNQIATLRLKIKTEIQSDPTSTDLENLSIAEGIIAEIYEIQETAGGSAEAIDIIKEKIDVLNSLNIDPLTEHFKNYSKTGVLPAIEDTEELIKTIKRQYKLEALKEMWIESFRNEEKARKQLADAVAYNNSVKEKEAELQNEANKAHKKWMDNIETENWAYDMYVKAREKGNYTLASSFYDLYSGLHKENSELEDKYEDLNFQLEEFRKNTDYGTDAIDDANAAIIEAQKENGYWSDRIDETVTDLNDQKKATEGVTEATTDFIKKSDGLKDTAKYVDLLGQAYKKLPTRFETYTTDGTIASSQGKAARAKASMTYMVPLYAGGGYPGDLFIANDGGPEMVGRIGSRTAVVNNDQIVAAVSRGVYTAVKEAFSDSGSSRGGDTVVQIDGREVFRAVVNQNNSVIRSTGNSPLL